MAAHQAPPSLGFSRQEHWSGLPFPSPMHESEKWKGSHSVVSDSSWPHGLQPTRLFHPWSFPGKSTGVGCHCLLWKTAFSSLLIQLRTHTAALAVYNHPRRYQLFWISSLVRIGQIFLSYISRTHQCKISSSSRRSPPHTPSLAPQVAHSSQPSLGEMSALGRWQSCLSSTFTIMTTVHSAFTPASQPFLALACSHEVIISGLNAFFLTYH